MDSEQVEVDLTDLTKCQKAAFVIKQGRLCHDDRIWQCHLQTAKV
jgi:hypothetical protein